MRRAFTIILAALWLAACSNQETTGEVNTEKPTTADSASLKVAVMPTLDCLPLYVAAERGLFQTENVSVALMPYTAQMDCDTAMANGHVEGMTTDLVRAERLKQQGVPLHYVASTNLFWQLVTAKNARIKQLKQLDDKMVAMTRYSATAMLADMLVDSAALETERVFRIQVNDVGVRLNMLENNIMDAMLLPEPQATAARLLNSNVIYDSRQGDLRLGVLAFSEKAWGDTIRRRQVESFMRAYATACDSLNERGVAAYSDIVARYCHVKPEMADSVPNDIRFSASEEPRQTDIDKVNAWLRKK